MLSPTSLSRHSNYLNCDSYLMALLPDQYFCCLIVVFIIIHPNYFIKWYLENWKLDEVFSQSQSKQISHHVRVIPSQLVPTILPFLKHIGVLLNESPKLFVWIKYIETVYHSLFQDSETCNACIIPQCGIPQIILHRCQHTSGALALNWNMKWIKSSKTYTLHLWSFTRTHVIQCTLLYISKLQVEIFIQE